MRTSLRNLLACIAVAAFATAVVAQTNNPNYPTWWNKFQQLASAGASGNAGLLAPLKIGTNEDASNECGPQSETSHLP